MALLGGVTSFLDRYVLGYALGTAAGPALRPFVTDLENEAWVLNPVMKPDVLVLAAGVAQGQVDEPTARGWAKQHGFDDPEFSALVDIANTGPGAAYAFELWRRRFIDKDGFERALKRLGVEQEWITALVKAHDVLLSPAEVANAVQQGHMPDDGILPTISAAVTVAGGAVTPTAPDGQPPSSVPLTQIDIDPLEQAEGHGLTKEQVQVLANLAGLPPGPETLLAMWNRNEIDEATVDAGIREGHMKTKWAGAYKRFRWAVLSGQEYAEARLRDWITDAEMYRGGALTGHTKEQMDLFYKNRGRTATPRQVWLAWARKVVAPDYPGDPANGRLTGLKDHELAIRRSNIRPEYAKMLWDVRFNYPPIFQLTRLVQSGAISADQAKTWADYQIYAPEVTAALHAYWVTLGGADGKELVKAELIAEFEGGFVSPSELRDHLTALGYSGPALELEIHLADARRIKSWRDKGITAVNKSFLNSAMTVDQAKVYLQELGVTDADTLTRLTDIWTLERGLP